MAFNRGSRVPSLTARDILVIFVTQGVHVVQHQAHQAELNKHLAHSSNSTLSKQHSQQTAFSANSILSAEHSQQTALLAHSTFSAQHSQHS